MVSSSFVILQRTDEVERCLEDLYICGANEFLGREFETLCYSTGGNLYQMTVDYKQAADAFVSAYDVLSESLKEYQKKWIKLDNNYYQ